MKVLDCLAPVNYRDDSLIISTVRRGIKWASLEVGDKVLIRHPDMSVEVADGGESPLMFSLAKVILVKTKIFANISEEDLFYNFEESCRRYTGILKRMEEIYTEFDVWELVTNVEVKIIRDCPR